MTKSLVIKILGSGAAGALAYLAVLPECAPFAVVLGAASAFILGALHIPRPGDKAAPKE